MRATQFQRSRGIIIVGATIWSRHARADLRLALDTGSASTIVRPEVVEGIGYGFEDAIRQTTIESTNEVEHGYTLRIPALSALGYRWRDMIVHVFALPPSWDDIDGLLGLSFLDAFNYEIRSKEGHILAERAR